jgi:hypothetical protein
MFIDLNVQSRRGLTIAEMWLAMAVSSIILVALLGLSSYAGKSFAALTNYVDLEQKSQIALDTMTKEIRQTDRLVSFGTTVLRGQVITNALTFMDSDGKLLSYTYTADGVLTRFKDDQSTMLLTNCDYLTFQVYNRTPSTNSFDNFQAGIPDNGKLISVTWVCSRTVVGSKLNTESVQTAKIVIRKQ